MCLPHQGPPEGWTEGALAPPLFGVIKKNNGKLGKFIRQVNQYRDFPSVSDLIFIWTKQKRNTLQEFQLPCHHLAYFGLAETHVRSREVYLEEFEPN